jgi:Ran GTPase-activating protein (RanGAP) involved in mRNA processing and transport
MIRLDGAADLCSYLIVNTTLTYLDLSFNSLGSIGGENIACVWCGLHCFVQQQRCSIRHEIRYWP